MPYSDEVTGRFFREESGKLLASVINLLGAANLDFAEDIVQDTMLAALNQWRFGLPENPRAWLYRVAKNKTIDFIRRHRRIVPLSPLLMSEWTTNSETERSFSDREMKDNQLRMMFASCYPELALPAQVAFMLKTLCGFSVKEIARAFLTNEETIAKRLYRAKEKFRKLGPNAIRVPLEDELPDRLQSVLKCIYLIFTEAYFSLSEESIIRKDFCNDAIYLCEHLVSHPVTTRHEVFALLALMCFHASRFDARMNENGLLLTFEEQDRERWNKELIRKGSAYLGRSMGGDHVSAYHLEAMIAAHYSLSDPAAGIDWLSILELYDHLILLNTSPTVKISRAFVLSRVKGVNEAIQFLRSLEDVQDNLFYNIMLGELYKQGKEIESSQRFYLKADALTESSKIKTFIKGKLEELRKINSDSRSS